MVDYFQRSHGTLGKSTYQEWAQEWQRIAEIDALKSVLAQFKYDDWYPQKLNYFQKRAIMPLSPFHQNVPPTEHQTLS